MKKLDKIEIIDLIRKIESAEINKPMTDLLKELFYIVNWYETNNYEKACLGNSVKRMRERVDALTLPDFKSEKELNSFLKDFDTSEDVKKFLGVLIYQFKKFRRIPLKHLLIKNFINPDFREDKDCTGYAHEDISVLYDKITK